MRGNPARAMEIGGGKRNNHSSAYNVSKQVRPREHGYRALVMASWTSLDTLGYLGRGRIVPPCVNQHVEKNYGASLFVFTTKRQEPLPAIYRTTLLGSSKRSLIRVRGVSW